MEPVRTQYSVHLASGELFGHDDIHQCLTEMRKHPKAQLFRNADRELLAYTTGMGPGRGGRQAE